MAIGRGRSRKRKPGRKTPEKGSKSTDENSDIDHKQESLVTKTKCAPVSNKVTNKVDVPKKPKPVKRKVKPQVVEDDIDEEEYSSHESHVTARHYQQGHTSDRVRSSTPTTSTSKSPGLTPITHHHGIDRSSHDLGEDDDDYHDDDDVQQVTPKRRTNPNDDQVPATPGRTFWQIPGKEEELCRLWEEEANLYDLGHPDHRNPLARNASMRRIANKLKISDAVVNTRINTLRTAYQKVVSQAAASGSSPHPKTARMREILRLCYFLHAHVKMCPSISSYSTSEKSEYFPTKNPVLIKTKAFALNERRLFRSKQDVPSTSSGYRTDDNYNRPFIGMPNLSDDECFEEEEEQDTMSHISISSDKSNNKRPAPKSKNKLPLRKSPRLSPKRADEISQCSQSSFTRAPVAKKSLNLSKIKSKNSDKFKYMSQMPEDIGVENDTETESAQGQGKTHEEWYSRQGTRGPKRGTSDNQMVQVMKDRSKLMERMTDNVGVLTQSVIKPPEEETVEVLWAKTVVKHMGRMEQKIKDRFMLYVHQVALDAIDGKLPKM